MTTGSNEQILLDSILEDYGKNLGSGLSPSKIFELFACEQVLKDRNVSIDEIEDGIVGGGLDGGIDAIFFFADGELISDLEELENIRRNVKIEVFVIQCKTKTSFEATAIDKMIVTSEQLFDFQRLDTLVDELAVTLIMKARFFKEIYKKTAPKFPEIIIQFCFSTKGSTSNIHPSVKTKEMILVEKVTKLFSTAKAKVCFLYYGAKELLELNRSEKPYTLTLNLHENPIVAEDGYLAIVKITDYYKFITDETGKLRKYIFDLNVRDYQGPVEVNQDIENSLDNDRDINFWILNNGVTVIADRGSAVAKDLTLENVQIVNGLQTSTCIYKFLTKNGLENEKRSILVKIVIKDDQAVIDKVIKAANFQTPIATASLKATDLLQREIEEYFKKNDLFYDRRKGYYKNIGKPSEKIVSIPFLAQSVITIVYREPDLARSRPSSLIKKDIDYNKVFSSKTALPIYLFCAKFMLRVQSFLRKDLGEKRNIIKNNFKFHIAFIAVSRLLGKSIYGPDELLPIADSPFDESCIAGATEWIAEVIFSFAEANKITLDGVAKSSQFKDHIAKLFQPV